MKSNSNLGIFQLQVLLMIGILLMIIPYLLDTDVPSGLYWTRVLMVNIATALITAVFVVLLFRKFNTGVKERLNLLISNTQLQKEGVNEISMLNNRDFSNKLEKEILASELIRGVINPVLPRDEVFFILKSLNHKKASKVKLILSKPSTKSDEYSDSLRRYDRFQNRNYKILIEELYHPEIEIRRVPNSAVNYTYLLTDTKVIFFTGNFYSREANTFGMLISRNSEIGKDFVNEFDLLWKEGIDFKS